MQNSTDTIDYGNLFMSLPSPHIIIRPDATLTIVDQNEAHAKLTHTKRSTVIGQPLLEAFPDTSLRYIKTGYSELAEAVRKVARTKKYNAPPLIQFNLRDKNGDFVEKWWRTIYYPLFNSVGEVALIYQVTEDVTHEIKAKQQAEHRHSQLNSALEMGLVSTWVWDMKKDIVTGDRNLASSFGVSAAKARAGMPLQTFIDSVHQDDRQQVADAISETINSNKPYSQEYRTVNAKGNIRWSKANGKVQYDADGSPEFFIGVLIDITDLKQTELRLAQSERQYNALFNSNIVAIVMATIEGEILQANTTFKGMFGYVSSDLESGLTSAQITFHKNDPVSQGIYNSLRAFGEAEPIRKEYKRKDGSKFTGLVGAAMLPDSANTFMAFIIDVTENEKLKALNRVKDDFVALASHQLRSPATIVKQYIGVTLNEMAGSLNEDQIQYLNTANNANNRQLTIIDDLLKTALIDTRGYAVTLQPKNIVKLVADCIQNYESIFEARGQKVVFMCDVDVIIIKADESELSICISNLLENASKYSARGTTVEVSINNEDSTAVLTVSDHGVGIAKENLGRVFEKFTRIDNELSDTVSGSGLGLYWVKRIVAIHGGQVTIKSKVGKGTSIAVRLPI